MLNRLKSAFVSRSELVEHVATLADWLEPASPGVFVGGQEAAEERLKQLDPQAYCRSRNFLDGKVTRLSPYIRHGILTLDQVRNTALDKVSKAAQIEKFIQELAWRDYWQRVYYRHPEYIWQDIENYKTGLAADDYADQLPEDIASGSTGVACIDQFIAELLDSGYLHNHARMYVAAYVVHWRRVKWQAGAKWFLHHLLDGDPASNNLSWQWVASTFSNKPYIFNLENVRKYAHPGINTHSAENKVLNASYDELNARLFPIERGAL
jgi:deoxyribodipyrimidine photo-lyase